MSDAEFLHYVDLIMSMGLSYKMGSISRDTFVRNLCLICQAINEEKE